MDKILVSVFVASLQEEFDVFIPPDLSLRELAQLLAQGLVEMSAGDYETSGHEVLCLKEPPVLLSQNGTPAQYNFHNGEELILV